MPSSPLILLVSQPGLLDRDTLATEFKRHKLRLTHVDSAKEAWQQMRSKGLPHLAIVDLTLPNDSGQKLCQELRDTAALPIIAIAPAGSSTESRVNMLHYVDDLVTLGDFDPKELAVRVGRILERGSSLDYAGASDLPIQQDVSFDPLHRSLTFKGEARRLTPTEVALLAVLLRHRGEIVEADTLVARVWGTRVTSDSMNALRVHMHRLRQKIEQDPSYPQLISTERGTGYRLK